MEKIQAELQYPIDKHSKSLIVDNVKLLLDYCIRFYDRQFITRENANKDILTRFENIVEDYLVTNASAEKVCFPYSIAQINSAFLPVIWAIC